MEAKKKIVILGGGPAGLSAAWKLSQEGFNVTVLEKNKVVGGMAATFAEGDFRFDYGPHNFHSVHKEVIEFIQNLLGGEFLEKKITTRVYHGKDFVKYPITGLDVFKRLGLFQGIKCGINFFYARLICFFTEPRNEHSFEDWIVRRFGRVLYNIYFSPYVRKVWKIEPAQLSKVVAEKRIPVLSIRKLIQERVLKVNKGYHPEDPAFIQHFYPKFGVGQICEKLAQDIETAGGNILYGSNVTRLELNKNTVVGITFTNNEGKENSIQLQSDDYVLSTIPISDLILCMEEQLSPNIISAASRLDFCATRFLYLRVNKENIFGLPWVYFSDSDIPFNRVTEMKNFSSAMAPEGQTGLCVELTCNYGDETWTMPDEKLYRLCAPHFIRLGLFREEEIIGYSSKRLRFAYPRFRVGYQKNLTTIFDHLKEMDNLISYSRQGLFTYSNVDGAIWMGFRVADLVKNKVRHFDYEVLFEPFYTYY